MITQSETADATNVRRRWVRVVHVQDIPLREGRAVRLNGREIAIFNLGNRFVAVDNRCPHRGGPLSDGIVSGASIVCPLHAWKFSLETGVGVSAPSQASCVETFRTRVEDEIVLLDLPIEPQEITEIPSACLESGEDPPWSSLQSVRVVEEI